MTILLISSVCINLYSQNGNPSSDLELRLNKLSVEEKMDQLQKVHKEIFQLPHDFDYIKSTIMGEFNAYRAIHAPNFPVRENLGNDQKKIDLAFKHWISSYPMEYKLCIIKGFEIIRKYK
ncbi:MAG: hypothetical protein H0V01_01190 [Bacteroidetes bacterium]|nr:hypothetical protein [Bacteroidota bacterium]HET6244784.1 hypothetical protein [Bacteroidia bacterium]